MNKKFTTKDAICVHHSTHIDPTTKGVVSPIFPSTSYRYRELPEVVYPRYYNTGNQTIIASKIAALELGEKALVLSSGMAAITTAFMGVIKSGDHVILHEAMYGGTFYFVKTQFERLGIDYTLVKGDQAKELKKALRPNTKLIYIETPSNPLLTIIDIASVAEFAKANGLISMIDNTFASPINQNPILLGIDVVLHSGTKYLSGHSDLIFGAIVCSEQLFPAIKNAAVCYGGNLNAMTCYLIERSLKTLAIRVRQQNENAMKLATYLSQHKGIDKVYYPGLKSHKGHELATRQMFDFGGMLSFELKVEHLQEVEIFLDNLTMIQPALSLGGIETLVCSPRRTSHAKMTKEERAAYGIKDNLLRLSVGIENVEELIQDIDAAIVAMKAQSLVTMK